MKKGFVYFIAAAAVAVVIFYMSSQTGVVSGNSSFSIATRISGGIYNIFGFSPDFYAVKRAEKILRKSAHFLLYAALGAFIALGVRSFREKSWRARIAAAVIVVAYAASDEVHQLFVPGRSGEIRDIFIDAAGAAFGAVVVFIIKSLKKQ